METLEALKKKVGSTEDLQSVVRTMKALAAVSIRQYEEAVRSLDAYNRTVELGLHVLLKDEDRTLTQAFHPPVKKTGVVVFGSDQGMCGQFNERIGTFAMNQIDEMRIDPEDLTLLVVGHRVLAQLESAKDLIDAVFSVPGSTSGITRSVQEVVLRIESWRSRRNIERIILFYNKSSGRSSYDPLSQQILPVDPEWLARIKKTEWPSKVLPVFRMESRRLFSALIRQYLFASIYRAFAESLASENASRLAAMQLAGKNIEETLEDLNSRYHQRRQSSITAELLDIASGFEALRDSEEQYGQGKSRVEG